MIAHVLTSWKTVGMFTYPTLLLDYPQILRYINITNQTNIIPEPNLFVCQIECTSDTLALIEDDPDYMVLWSDAQ